MCQCYYRGKCWTFDLNKAIRFLTGPRVNSVCVWWCDVWCNMDLATPSERVGVILYLCCTRLLPDISLSRDSLSMICPLPEKFLTSFDMNRKFGGDLVSHPPGPGESEKWNQAEYWAAGSPLLPPLLKFLMNKSLDCGIGFVGPTGRGQLTSSTLSTFEQALEFIIPTCKVMHSNQHFLKSASSSLEGRGGKVRYFSLGELQILWLVARINIEFTDWLLLEIHPVWCLNKVRANTRGGWVFYGQAWSGWNCCILTWKTAPASH